MDNTQLLLTLLPEAEKEELLDTLRLLTKRSLLGKYIHRSLKHLKPVPIKEIDNFLHGRPIKQGISGAEIIAVLVVVCKVMSFVCPLVGQKIPKEP